MSISSVVQKILKKLSVFFKKYQIIRNSFEKFLYLSNIPYFRLANALTFEQRFSLLQFFSD